FGRNLLGNMLQIGFHYQVLGYDIYFGEVLVAVEIILLVGFLCIKGKRIAIGLQTGFALLLVLGVFACAAMVLPHSAQIAPYFSTPDLTDQKAIWQIGKIIALSPWAFVGFESISHSVEGFRFPVKKSIYVIGAALGLGAVVYILLTFLAVAVLPEGYKSWDYYIFHLGDHFGKAELPVFYAVHERMGVDGVWLLGFAAFSAVMTGLIGNLVAASRLMYAMAQERILPKWFGKLNADGIPGNAVSFLMVVSLFVPFLGRTTIGWIIDVNTVGAAIAYGFTSASAFVLARREGNKRVLITGAVGFLMSVYFFLYFMAWSSGAMSTESYLILAFWSILGFLYYRHIFKKDTERRFGNSTIVWLGMVFLILFTSLMWVRQATRDMNEIVVENIREYYEEKAGAQDRHVLIETEKYLRDQLLEANQIQTRNSIVQMVLILISLWIMFSIFSVLSEREKQMSLEKFRAEESSKSKSIFLSNMSHDIRTPMNAIIGYINLAEQEEDDAKKLMEYIEKIKTSSHHLLALINDVLEMSRIESGKVDLEPIPVDLKKTMLEVRDMFSTQMNEKDIDFIVRVDQVRNGLVLCDKNRLNRALLNLLSNAYKFTPENGTVSVSLWQIDDGDPDFGNYELRVNDSGIGMTKDFAEKIFEAFERERTSTVSGIQGTGLGMAITKNIIDLMGGTIEVNTAPGQGTEFVIRLKFELQKGIEQAAGAGETAVEATDSEPDFSNMRLLLVDDIDVNREIAANILQFMGFEVETAVNGKEAVEKVAASEPGHFDAVLMDIQMPVMDGYEATREIRKLENPALSSVPVLAMTANAFSEDVKKAMDAGMNEHIAKPIDVEDLKAKLEKISEYKSR
ncbi:MAG: amino acid permease, partial [Lachnospiraceae bacterium]|nr:amino acid permease [Lachnospiraceae bacterium]